MFGRQDLLPCKRRGSTTALSRCYSNRCAESCAVTSLRGDVPPQNSCSCDLCSQRSAAQCSASACARSLAVSGLGQVAEKGFWHNNVTGESTWKLPDALGHKADGSNETYWIVDVRARCRALPRCPRREHGWWAEAACCRSMPAAHSA